MSSKRIAVFLLFLVLAAIILVTGCMTENPPERYGGIMGTMTFYTEDNYPYNYLENGTLKGITRISSKRSRKRWEIGYPGKGSGWNTLVQRVSGSSYRQQHNDLCHCTDPLTGDFLQMGRADLPVHNRVFARPGQRIIISSPDDLKAYRIGAVR